MKTPQALLQSSAVALALAASTLAPAGVNRWTSLRPSGGAAVCALIADPGAPDTINGETVLAGVVSAVDLKIDHFAGFPERVEPGGLVRFDLHSINDSDFDALGVTARLELAPGLVFVDVVAKDWSCGHEEQIVSCTMQRFPSGYTDGSPPPILVTARVPASSQGGALTSVASLMSETPDFNGLNNSARAVIRVWRHLLITTASDSGQGSLRQALLDANEGCDRDDVPCRVLFQIPPPVPLTGWFTIRLSTPLPPVTATNLTLDGTAQTAFTGDTNLAGPEIDLNGGALAEGNGLEVRSAGDFEVSGLVISGFPENGILFDASSDRSSFNSAYLVTGNYIGTDPTGTVAVANGLRGVAVFLDSSAANPFRWAQGPIAHLTVRSNLISGNGRSGIFIDSGLYVSIENNRIGVKAASDEPLPNGASGVYFGIASGLGCVDHNLIAHNADFGIALEPNAPNVWIAQNSIVGNRLYGVDIGLDLATPGGTNNVEPRPLLTSARYDESTGTTTVLGNVPPGIPSLFGGYTIDLYGNSSLAAKGEGETWLGVIQTSATDFTFVFNGNLIGKAITATLTRTSYEGFLVSGNGYAAASLPLCQEQGFLQQTSEFSDPIEVAR